MAGGGGIILGINSYPKELTKNREAVEFNFVFSLWKDTDLIYDYKKIVSGTDIITEDAIFYYDIAIRLKKMGFNAFDNTTIYTFLTDKPVVKAEFEKRGGYATVAEILQLINVDNIEAYYDELIKSNLILNLYDAGFNVMENISKLEKMSSTEIYDFYDYKLNSIIANKIEKIKVENLSTGYEEYIDEWDSGKTVGFKIGYPILNYHLAGVHKQNLLLHCRSIGKGKTTTAILYYILPVIENGQNVCIIANEQNTNDFRQMILATVLFNKLGSTGSLGMNRQKLITGHFTSNQKAALYAAAEWLASQKGKITFVPLDDYGVDTIVKVVKSQSKLGIGMFVVDTLKPRQENSDKAWADFSEVAKQLFMLAKKEDVAIVATAQLSSDSLSRKFLDLSCVGKSRAIAETAGQVTMFRPLSKDEKAKMKAYVYPRDENGKTSKVKKWIDLDPDEDYIVLFIPKNRFGSTDVQICYKRNMSFNTMEEIGYIEIPYDGFKTK